MIPKQPTGRTAVALVKDGQYAIELTEGEWTVNIQAVRETGPVIPSLGEAPREQYVPRKYNSDSTLSIEVPGGGKTQDFDLEK
ncbi:MAG: hypothetical protein KF847_20235 [Pirellulales bacterium]|nr:hypothetical protein [Pirellulales bacterium]